MSIPENDRSNFAEIRQYIDWCLSPKTAPTDMLHRLTVDSRQLHTLVDDLEKELVAEKTEPMLPMKPDVSRMKPRNAGKALRKWAAECALAREAYQQNQTEIIKGQNVG